MNATAKIVLGLATIWPLVYIAIFIGFVFSMVLSNSQEMSSAQASHTMPPAFVSLLFVHIATILEGIALLVFYIVDVFRNPRVTSEQRLLWAIVIFVGGPIGMIVYWFLNIWRTPPPLAQGPLEQV